MFMVFQKQLGLLSKPLLIGFVVFALTFIVAFSLGASHVATKAVLHATTLHSHALACGGINVPPCG